MKKQPRRAPRIPYDDQVVAYLGNRRIPCRASNISNSGILVHPPEVVRAAPDRMVFPQSQVKPSQFMRLLFRLGRDGEWIDADAVLVRQADEQARFGWGIRFLRLPPHFEVALKQYQAAQLSASPQRVAG